MSTPFLVHHVDYRSKAKERQAELDDLRKRSLAKPKAARLQDAEAPIELYHAFLEKQRQMFVDQRKCQAAAIEFLHQYRADDDLVLRKTSQRHLHTNLRRQTLSPSLIPDARAAVYTPPTLLSYPKTPPFSTGRSNKTNNLGPARIVSNQSTPAYTIQNDPIEFERILIALQNRAKEAAQIPLPNEDDEEPILILEAASPRNQDGKQEGRDMPAYDFLPMNDSIPFESFLKLGESQIMQQQTRAPLLSRRDGLLFNSNQVELDDDETYDDSSDNDSIIPGLSFMNLGASMLAEALHSPKRTDVDENEDDDTAPLTDPWRSQMDDSAHALVQGQQATVMMTAAATSTEKVTAGVESNSTETVTASVESSTAISIATPGMLCVNDASNPTTGAMATYTRVESLLTDVAKVIETDALREASEVSSRGIGVEFESKGAVEHQVENSHDQMDILFCPAHLAKERNDITGVAENIGKGDIVTSASFACANMASLELLVENSQHSERGSREIECDTPGSVDLVGDETTLSLNLNLSDVLPAAKKVLSPKKATSELVNDIIVPDNVVVGFDTLRATPLATEQRRIEQAPRVVNGRQRATTKRKKAAGYYPSSSLFVSRQYFSR